MAHPAFFVSAKPKLTETMKQLSNILGGLMLISLFVFITGCEYDHPVPEPLPDVVSFSDNLIPYFNASCNYAGCHNAGGEAPDLTPENAYGAIMDGNYINLDNPEESLFYTKVATGGSMAPYSTPGNTALVLAWIKAGALDN
jgi:hypothetical protein